MRSSLPQTNEQQSRQPVDKPPTITCPRVTEKCHKLRPINDGNRTGQGCARFPRRIEKGIQADNSATEYAKPQVKKIAHKGEHCTINTYKRQYRVSWELLSIEKSSQHTSPLLPSFTRLPGEPRIGILINPPLHPICHLTNKPLIPLIDVKESTVCADFINVLHKDSYP
jgi:hypothetical protein